MPMATKEAQRKYMREWVAARRRRWLDANGPCRRCASWDRLELDHVDRTTKVAHNIWSWSKARRDEELAKCQVLCHDCHVAKSKAEFDYHQGQGPQHGSSGMYCRQKCRCDLCRAWNLARQRRGKSNAVA